MRGEWRGAEGFRREIGVQELSAHIAFSAREEDPGKVLEGSYHASHLAAAGGRGGGVEGRGSRVQQPKITVCVWNCYIRMRRTWLLRTAEYTAETTTVCGVLSVWCLLLHIIFRTKPSSVKSHDAFRIETFGLTIFSQSE